MRFDSVAFGVLVLVALVLHLVLRGRLRALALFAVGNVFYGAWDWRFLGLVWLSIVVDFAVARGIAADHARGRSGRRFLVTSLVTNLGVLGAFKYAGFFIDSAVELAALLGVNVPRPALTVVLPVGISFYTFQTLSYTIDVYRKSAPAERDLLTFAQYVMWFPQLVAGPIERPQQLIPQLATRQPFRAQQVSDGLLLIAWGVFKKTVIADRIASVVEVAYGTSAPASGVVEVWLGTCAFALQILADFSAYTDIARGTSKLFGVELTENFRAPYLAHGPREFWRRWHITLSTWLRDYLYVPLGGNRGSRARTARNLMVTMLLGGLWHGAAWTFVWWGAWHGALLIAERALGLDVDERRPWVRVVRVLAMFQLTLFGWMLFRAQSLAQVGALLSSCTSVGALGGRAREWLLLLAATALPLVVMRARMQALGERDPMCAAGQPMRALFVLFVIASVLLLRVQERIEFLYFQF